MTDEEAFSEWVNANFEDPEFHEMWDRGVFIAGRRSMLEEIKDTSQVVVSSSFNSQMIIIDPKRLNDAEELIYSMIEGFEGTIHEKFFESPLGELVSAYLKKYNLDKK